MSVVERAVIRIQPPAILVARAGALQSPEAMTYPPLVACTDADGSLESACHEDLVSF
jgi:hypothetical protein